MKKYKDFIKVGDSWLRKSLISEIKPNGIIVCGGRTYLVPVRTANRIANELGI